MASSRNINCTDQLFAEFQDFEKVSGASELGCQNNELHLCSLVLSALASLSTVCGPQILSINSKKSLVV